MFFDILKIFCYFVETEPMKKTNSNHFLEQEFLFLQKLETKHSISIQKFLEIFSEKSQPFLLIVLSLPFCQPLQIPGFSTPFGLLIAWISFRMMLKKDLWLPQFVLSKKITPTTLKKIATKGLYVIKKFKKWIYPRWAWTYRSSVMKVVNSICLFLGGIILALPLPIPLTNLLSGWAIFLIGLGILEDDGLIIILGYIVSVLSFLLIALSLFSIQWLT